MKIEKVNENQIRCTLTREDLASRELKISELAYGTEKAKSLFRDMMQQANFEFGFEAEDIPLMIEAIPLNADCIVLIITKVEDPDELDTRFSRFAPSVTEESDEDSDESTADEVLDLFRRIQSEDNTASAPEAPSASAPEESDSVRSRLFRMESLKQVINAAVIAVLVQCELTGAGIFGICLSGLVRKFNGKKALSGQRQIIGIARDAERSLGIIGIILSDLNTRILHSQSLHISHAYGLVLDLNCQHIIKGLAGGAFLFIADGRCIGQIVGHNIHSVLLVYHTRVCGV